MKILHVVSRMDPELGGVSQAVRTMIDSLKDLNTGSEVLCLDNPNAAFLEKDTFITHALGPSKGPWSYTAALLPWLRKNCGEYDRIIIHGLWQYTTFAVFTAIKSYKKTGKKHPQYYVMPHGMLDPYFQKASGRKMKALRNWLFWKFIERKVINQASALLFTCEEELLLARIPFSPYHPRKEIVVGLGVEKPPVSSPSITAAFREKYPQLSNRPFLLFMSRIHEKKGIDLLVNAYEKLLKNCAVTGRIIPELVIAGPGIETPFGELIKKRVEESVALAANITFTGMLSGDVKWGAVYNAEAFILPSHQENFGIAVVEALACGKSVLISNQINIWREIKASEAGFVEDDTEAGVEKLVESWINLSEAKRGEMSQQALDCYRVNFSIELPAKRIVNALALTD